MPQIPGIMGMDLYPVRVGDMFSGCKRLQDILDAQKEIIERHIDQASMVPKDREQRRGHSRFY